MREEELLEMLESGDYGEVSRALIYIEKKLEERPSRKLIAKLVELCSDSDPDIREEAVRAAGFYWQLPEALPVLVSILNRADEDDLVLNAAVFAIGEIGQNEPSLRDRILNLLAHVALNEAMPLMIRQSAYALALRLAGRISIDDFAKISVSNDIIINNQILLSLINLNY